MEARDGVWAHPDLLPDSSDLDNPAAFVDRVLGGGEASTFHDPIAQLEQTEAREREERNRDQGDAGESEALVRNAVVVGGGAVVRVAALQSRLPGHYRVRSS